MTGFAERVYDIVRTIPAGEVLTYGEVAQRVGNPRAARAVGALMRANSRSFMTHPNDPTAVPCHRVVSARYRLGGFNAGQTAKARLLEREGWRIVDGRLVSES